MFTGPIVALVFSLVSFATGFPASITRYAERAKQRGFNGVTNKKGEQKMREYRCAYPDVGSTTLISVSLAFWVVSVVVALLSIFPTTIQSSLIGTTNNVTYVPDPTLGEENRSALFYAVLFDGLNLLNVGGYVWASVSSPGRVCERGMIIDDETSTVLP